MNFRRPKNIQPTPTHNMSATDVMPMPLPVTLAMLPQPPTEGFLKTPGAPMKPRTVTRVGLKPVPIEVEEKESVSDLFNDTFVEESEAWDPNPMASIERVFFDNNTNTLYKLFVDGTWESLKLNLQ